MKKEILADKVKLEPCPDNQDVFGEKFDWGEENARKSSLSREWGSMKEDQRLEYDSIEDFFQKNLFYFSFLYLYFKIIKLIPVVTTATITDIFTTDRLTILSLIFMIFCIFFVMK